MRKAKFWIKQVVMVALLALVFGAPAFAEDPSDGARSKNQSSHADDTAQGKANDKSAVGDTEEGGTPGTLQENTSTEDTPPERTL